MRKLELSSLLLILGLLVAGLYLLFDTYKYSYYASPAQKTEVYPRTNHTYYYSDGNGYLLINKGDGPRLLTCNLSGWDRQMLYYRHDLPVVAEGCMILEPTDARAQATSRMVPDL